MSDQDYTIYAIRTPNYTSTDTSIYREVCSKAAAEYRSAFYPMACITTVFTSIGVRRNVDLEIWRPLSDLFALHIRDIVVDSFISEYEY